MADIAAMKKEKNKSEKSKKDEKEIIKSEKRNNKKVKKVTPERWMTQTNGRQIFFCSRLKKKLLWD